MTTTARKGEIMAAVLAETGQGFHGSAKQLHRLLVSKGKDYAYGSVWSALQALGRQKRIGMEAVGSTVLYGTKQHANRLMVDLDTMRAEWV